MQGQYDRTGHKPNYGTWADVPIGEQNSINNLLDQWEQLVGYTVKVPDNIKADMASWSISSLFQAGEYLFSHIYDFIDPDALQHSIWAKWGLTYDDFNSKQHAFDQTMLQLTGQKGTWDQFASLMDNNQGNPNLSEFSEQFKQDPNNRKTYGWLAYGMDYDQFLQQKTQFENFLGTTLTNDQAVSQLQYMHAGASASQSISQSPTLSQLEKRQAQTGISGNVVR